MCLTVPKSRWADSQSLVLTRAVHCRWYRHVILYKYNNGLKNAQGLLYFSPCTHTMHKSFQTPKLLDMVLLVSINVVNNVWLIAWTLRSQHGHLRPRFCPAGRLITSSFLPAGKPWMTLRRSRWNNMYFLHSRPNILVYFFKIYDETMNY